MTRDAHNGFSVFFQGEAMGFLVRAVELALDEDGPDLTAQAVFGESDALFARIVAKEETIVAGLPIISIVLERLGAATSCKAHFAVPEGSRVPKGTVVATIDGPATILLKAERVMLNFICHLSGIANLTNRYVQAVAGTKTRLLDTRKTLPGLRYPEKYAVLLGGGSNHRKNLAEMLMLKDNHIDRAGGVSAAISALRDAYRDSKNAMPPMEVECRTLAEVDEAVALRPSRIMLDNMDDAAMAEAISRIPAGIETEISGGVGIEALPRLARLGADFISVGRITHSAPAADFSMQLSMNEES